MTMLQIRNVPDEVHRKLKARAAMAGTSLSEYALAELRRSVERPTREELMAELLARPTRELDTSAAEVLRAERDAR
jgi:plasmid stability protein